MLSDGVLDIEGEVASGGVVDFWVRREKKYHVFVHSNLEIEGVSMAVFNHCNLIIILNVICLNASVTILSYYTEYR